jgi:thiamine pyrophosphokinase
MIFYLVAGSPAAQPPLKLAPGPGDRVIAADRGAHHARAWGWPVDLAIGDFDSAPEDDVRTLVSGGIPMIKAPAAKDQTDLELALAQALAAGARRIVICAALAGRTDHLLANVLLLAKSELRALDVSIADGAESVRLLQRPTPHDTEPAKLVLDGAPGDLLSLLPLGADVRGVSTRGLLYPLQDETLALGLARGVSNVFTEPRPEVRLRRGRLLVIHTRSEAAR